MDTNFNDFTIDDSSPTSHEKNSTSPSTSQTTSSQENTDNSTPVPRSQVSPLPSPTTRQVAPLSELNDYSPSQISNTSEEDILHSVTTLDVDTRTREVVVTLLNGLETCGIQFPEASDKNNELLIQETDLDNLTSSGDAANTENINSMSNSAPAHSENVCQCIKDFQICDKLVK